MRDECDWWYVQSKRELPTRAYRQAKSYRRSENLRRGFIRVGTLMFVYMPKNSLPMLVVCDSRSLGDKRYDVYNEIPRSSGRCAVLRAWPFGRAAFGRDWARVPRVALFDHGQEDCDAGKAREALLQFCYDKGICRVVALQSRSRGSRKSYSDEDVEAGAVSGTVCWDAFDPPGSLAECSGTFWWPPGVDYDVLALPNPLNVDYSQHGLVLRWLGWARVEARVGVPSASGSEPIEELAELLASDRPVAFDIETYQNRGTELITAIGLSNGQMSVSVPWHDVLPYGATEIRRGLADSLVGRAARRVLREKRLYGWNARGFDVPFLRRNDVEVNDDVFDGYVFHALELNQLRHGLQRAAAGVMPVPPWKTMHQAAAKLSGLKPDDPRAWIHGLDELYEYNRRDAFYTWHLCAWLERFARGEVTL